MWNTLAGIGQSFLNALPGTLEQGLIYAILALGVLITYSILDFPDLSVDGTFPLGGAVSTMLIMRGVHPLAALLAAACSGVPRGVHDRVGKARVDDHHDQLIFKIHRRYASCHFTVGQIR